MIRKKCFWFIFRLTRFFFLGRRRGKGGGGVRGVESSQGRRTPKLPLGMGILPNSHNSFDLTRSRSVFGAISRRHIASSNSALSLDDRRTRMANHAHAQYQPHLPSSCSSWSVRISIFKCSRKFYPRLGEPKNEIEKFVWTKMKRHLLSDERKQIKANLPHFSGLQQKYK